MALVLALCPITNHYAEDGSASPYITTPTSRKEGGLGLAIKTVRRRKSPPPAAGMLWIFPNTIC
jgi:hypothetical protein